MRDRDHRARVTAEMLLEPVHAVGVEMVGRLVEQENGGFLQQQPRERDPAALTTGEVIDDRLARRTTQRVHRHIHLRCDIPRAKRVDFFLQRRLSVRDRVLRFVVHRLRQFVPTRVVGRREIREVLHALLDARTHRRPRRQRRLLREKPHRVARLKMHATVDLGVDPGEDAHERRFAGAVETEDADLRAEVERQRNVAEDFLALDFLRDAEHGKNDLRSFFGFGHARNRLGFRRSFKPREKRQRIPRTRAAHRFARPQTPAHRRSLRFSENRTLKIRQQLHAPHARRLPQRHPRNRRRDRRRDATRATVGPTFHGTVGHVLGLHAFPHGTASTHHAPAPPRPATKVPHPREFPRRQNACARRRHDG